MKKKIGQAILYILANLGISAMIYLMFLSGTTY